jgi:RNA polymerase sigma factor (sigma-70 family)
MLLSDGLEVNTRHDFWAQFCTDYYQPGVDFATYRLGNLEDAYDIVHASVVRILRFLPDPDRIGDRKNYWIKTIQNQCYELLKKRKLEATQTISRDTPSKNDDGEEVLPPDPADQNRDPEMNALINEENELLLRALDMHCAGLTEREKALLALRFAGYTAAEISSMWNEGVKVIRADLNAIMAKLRYRILHRTK